MRAARRAEREAGDQVKKTQLGAGMELTSRKRAYDAQGPGFHLQHWRKTNTKPTRREKSVPQPSVAKAVDTD